jgi:Rrf2 family nitric oxide-sensitive transcriptional repressor
VAHEVAHEAARADDASQWLTPGRVLTDNVACSTIRDGPNPGTVVPESSLRQRILAAAAPEAPIIPCARSGFRASALSDNRLAPMLASIFVPDALSRVHRIMRLTDYTDYSLRVMLYLAVRPDGLSTIQEISDAYGISKNHLMKIVQRLGELGWIETVRGRNGGLKLNERSGALTIGEVVRKTESDFSIVGCFAGDDEAHRHCVIQSHCRLRGLFAAARDAFLAELDKHTVAELAHPANELAGLLGIVRFIPDTAARGVEAT